MADYRYLTIEEAHRRSSQEHRQETENFLGEAMLQKIGESKSEKIEIFDRRSSDLILKGKFTAML
jgi:hypothetical protein